MPAIVDHDKRRREVADVAADLVASGGTEAVTVRRVAEAAGYSTKFISHYFADKRALLLMTYRHATEHSGEVADASQAGGKANVSAYLTSLLPTNPASRRDWSVWLAFWGLATSDPAFAAEQKFQVKRARRRVVELFATDPLYSGMPDSEREENARELLTLLTGIAVQAVFDPSDWPAKRQRQLIERRLQVLTMQ